MSVKLKPCPFCGGDVEAKDLDDDIMGEISCYHCDITMSASAVGNLVNAWNTRVNADDQCPTCGDHHDGAAPLACETGDGV